MSLHTTFRPTTCRYYFPSFFFFLSITDSAQNKQQNKLRNFVSNVNTILFQLLFVVDGLYLDMYLALNLFENRTEIGNFNEGETLNEVNSTDKLTVINLLFYLKKKTYFDVGSTSLFLSSVRLGVLIIFLALLILNFKI